MKRNAPMHPKTVMLASMLGIPRFQAVGLLELLFHFTAQYCPQGDVGRRTNSAIAAFLDWPNLQADKLIQALTEAEWLDEDDDHRLLVRNWHEHADGTCKKYLQRNNLPFLTCPDNSTYNRHYKAECPDMSGHVETSPDSHARARVPEPEPEPEPESCAPGDDVHLFLVEHEALSTLTYEQDLEARRSAGIDIKDPQLMEIAKNAASAAILMGHIDHPGSWWKRQIEKNKKSSGADRADDPRYRKKSAAEMYGD